MRSSLIRAVKVADAVAVGDLSQRLNNSNQDEVGGLARALDRMSDGLQKKVDEASTIADGDLTVDVQVSGPKDAFGSALKQHISNLSTQPAVEVIQAVNSFVLSAGMEPSQLGGACRSRPSTT